MDLSTITLALAQLISAFYSVFTGNLSALFNLLSPILSLRTVAWGSVLSELQALTPAERQTLDAQFASALSLPNPALLAKIVGVESALEATVTLAQQGYGVYQGALAILAQLKAVFDGQTTSAPKQGASAPSWLTSLLPGWFPSWLTAIIVGLVPAIIQAAEIALPSEAPLFAELLAFWNGAAATPRLKAAYASFHKGA